MIITVPGYDFSFVVENIAHVERNFEGDRVAVHFLGEDDTCDLVLRGSDAKFFLEQLDALAATQADLLHSQLSLARIRLEHAKARFLRSARPKMYKKFVHEFVLGRGYIPQEPVLMTEAQVAADKASAGGTPSNVWYVGVDDE